ncbi:nucleolin-like [Hippocampus comes]|uniref:nucleolin-like n=1 Tax=Hippocampus comes TaxID=109280 RepID=UPI00094E3FDA|nr:PREDICTED: nucleolin-like [Hippocampus comes]
MNQDLLSGGSSSRRSRGSGGPAARGNASSSAAQAPQQPSEEADEDEHMNRVLEDEERPRQQPETSQVDADRGSTWAPDEPAPSNGPPGENGGDEEGPPSKVNRCEKGPRWTWRAEQRQRTQEDEEEDEEDGREEEEEEEDEEAEEGLMSPSIRNNATVASNNVDSHQSSSNKKPETSQVDADRGSTWAPDEPAPSNGPPGENGGDEEGPTSKCVY